MSTEDSEIYVSSREDKVFDALATQPFGFVRKSNFLHDLISVIERFLSETTTVQPNKPVIVLQQKSGMVTIDVESIRYIEGRGKNQLLFCERRSEPMVVHSTLDALADELAPYGFIRIHKGFLVNYLYISAILAAEVELKDETLLPLSRRRAQEIREQYLDLLKEHKILLG